MNKKQMMKRIIGLSLLAGLFLPIVANADSYTVKSGDTLSAIAKEKNTTTITVKNDHKTISVTGISIGGGNIQATELNGFAISLNMNTPTIIIVHQDVPGMIAHVTEALSRYDINIAQMNVTREKAGEKAIMIIEVDSRSCEAAIEDIRKIPHLHNVNFFK